MPPGPDPALKRLERFVGTWNATGRTLDSKLAQDGAVMRKVITSTLVSVDGVIGHGFSPRSPPRRAGGGGAPSRA
jgi:hypothetical protein